MNSFLTNFMYWIVHTYSTIQIIILSSSFYQLSKDILNTYYSTERLSQLVLVKNGKEIKSVSTHEAIVKIHPLHVHTFDSSVPLVIEINKDCCWWEWFENIFKVTKEKDNKNKNEKMNFSKQIFSKYDFDFAIIKYQSKEMQQKNQPTMGIVCHSMMQIQDILFYLHNENLNYLPVKECENMFLAIQLQGKIWKFIKEKKETENDEMVSTIINNNNDNEDENEDENDERFTTWSTNVFLIDKQLNFSISNNILNELFWKYYVCKYCFVDVDPSLIDISSLVYMDSQTFEFITIPDFTLTIKEKIN